MTQLAEIITIYEHTRLPYKHPSSYPLDQADLRLHQAKELLKIRIDIAKSRAYRFETTANEVDPEQEGETPDAIRCWGILQRLNESLESLENRLEFIGNAMRAIEDAHTESRDQRVRAIKDRKRRAK